MGCTASTTAQQQQHSAATAAGPSHKNTKQTPTSQEQALSNIEPTHGRIIEFSSNVKDCYAVQKQIGEGSIGNIYLVQRKMEATPQTTATTTSGEPAVPEQAPPKNTTTTTLGSNFYALKEIDMDLVEPQFLEEMRNEINLLKVIDHPNILKAFEVYDTQKNNKSSKSKQPARKGPGISIVMEYCSGGDLHTRSPCSSEHQAKVIVAKLVEAINYLHLLGIIVRIIYPVLLKTCVVAAWWQVTSSSIAPFIP